MLYNLFKFLHITGAIVWLGSGVALIMLTSRLSKADRAGLVATWRQVEALGGRLFGPAAMGTLLFGILSVLSSRGGVRFSDPWILIGFAGFAISLVIQVITNPIGKRMMAAAAAGGPDDPQVGAAMSRLATISRVDLAILFAVVLAMVFKPDFGG